MFDFNVDGKTDSGEQFMGYQIFSDTTKELNSKRIAGRRINVFDIVVIILFIWQMIILFTGGR